MSLAAILNLAAVGLIVAALIFSRRPPATPLDVLLADRLRARVVATLKTGATFQGVLYDADDRSVVLRQAHALSPNDADARLPVDGELILARSEIEYLQRPWDLEAER